jgi:hypothetical protein
MSWMQLVTLLAILLLIAGCDSGPPTAGTVVTFATVCDKANEDKRVALEGYLDFPPQFKAKDLTIMMRLRPTPFSAKDDRIVGASVRLGAGPNHVALPPRKYTANDLRVTTNDGKTMSAADRVKVSGRMYYPSPMASVEFKCWPG